MATTGVIDSVYGANMSLHMPEYREKIFLRKGDQFAEFFEFVQALGRLEPVSQESGGHWEEGDRWGWLEVATTAAAGANNAATVVEVVPTSGKIFARENDIIEFQNGVQGIIQSVTPGTPFQLSVIPITLNQAIPAVTANDLLRVGPSSWGEGTAQPEGRRKQFVYEEYFMQTFKETIEATGTEKTNKTWVSMPDGNGVNSLWHINQPDAEYRAKMQIQDAFISGKQITNPAAQVDSAGNVRSATEGMLEFASTRGRLWNGIASGGLTLATFDAIEDYAVSQRSEGLLMFFSGLARAQEINTLMKTDFQDANINEVRKAVDKNIIYPELSMSAIVNYKLLQLSKCTMMFTSFDALNNPNTYSLSGFKSRYQEVSVVVPFGKVRTSDGKKLPHFSFAYKEHAGYNRGFEVWEDGSAKSSNRIGPVDKDLLYIRSQMATRFAGGNQWQIITT